MVADSPKVLKAFSSNPPGGRKRLGEALRLGVVYLGLDLVWVSAGRFPAQVFNANHPGTLAGDVEFQWGSYLWVIAQVGRYLDVGGAGGLADSVYVDAVIERCGVLRLIGPAFESPRPRIPISSLQSLSTATSWLLQGGMGPGEFHTHDLGRSILGVGHSSTLLLTLTGLLAGSSLISSPAGVGRQLVRYWKKDDVFGGFREFLARHTNSVTRRTVKLLSGRVFIPLQISYEFRPQ